MKIHNKTSHLAAVAASALVLTGSASAATVSWGSAQDISSFTEVSTNGSLVASYSGRATSGSYSVNGVSFADGNAPVPTYGQWDIGSGRVPVIDTGAGDNAIYRSMLQQATFFSGTQTVTLSGLTNGLSYEVQMWNVDTHSSAVGLTIDPAGAAVTLVANTGQFAIGTFTADGTEQFISVRADGANASINGLQLREAAAAVPEPSTTALLGLGGLALVFRRRK